MIIEDLYDETIPTSSAFRTWLSLDGTDEDSCYIAESDTVYDTSNFMYIHTADIKEEINDTY